MTNGGGGTGTRGWPEIIRPWWKRLRGPVAQDGVVLVPLMVFLTLDRRAPEWWSSDIGALVLIGGLAIVRTAAIVMRRRGPIGRAALWATAGLAAVAGLGISLAVTLIFWPTVGLVVLVAVAVAISCATLIFMRWRRLRARGAARGAWALQALAAVAGAVVVALLIWSLDVAPWAVVAALTIAGGVIIVIRLRGLRAAIWGARKSALARGLPLIGYSIICLIRLVGDLRPRLRVADVRCQPVVGCATAIWPPQFERVENDAQRAGRDSRAATPRRARLGTWRADHATTAAEAEPLRSPGRFRG